MERLTYRDKDGMAMMKERSGRKSGGIDRLAAYEDTDLEPEEIKNALDVNDIIPEINVTVDHIRDLLQAEQDGRLVVLPEPLKRAIVREGGRCFSDFTMDDINNLLEAWDAGRLVVLPCKVGDTVYVIGESCDFCETYLDEPERCMRCEKGHYVEERGFELWMLSELNESIFLTREEADAALAGKGGDV